MTFRRGINSKGKSKDFLKRGFKSMFPNYEETQKAVPPVDTESDRKKRPASA